MDDETRVTLRIPADVYRAVQRRARAESRSLNGEIVWMLRQQTARRQEASHMANLVETWNGWTNYQPQQEFMDTSREQGHVTVEDAVTAYLGTDTTPGYYDYLRDEVVREDDAPLDERAAVHAALVAYLERTWNEEWR